MPEKQAKAGEKNPPRITVRLDSALSDAVKRIAFESGRSENAVYVEAVREYVERQGAG